MKTYHWIDENTGELRRNLWDVIYNTVWEFFWCIKRSITKKKHCPFIHRKWRYSRKGW